MSDGDGEKSHPLRCELQNLIQRDERIFEFIEGSSLDGMWFWDLENPEHEWMSDSFWQNLGYDPNTKQHLASEWQDIIFPEDLPLAIENFQKHCADPNHPYDQIVRYRHASGRTVWIRCRGLAIRDKNGKPIRMLGSHTDISELKQQEIEKLELERQQTLAFQKQAILLEQLEATANIGTWEVDLLTNTTSWSPQMKRIHEVVDDYHPNLNSSVGFYAEGESRRSIINALDIALNLGEAWNLEVQLTTAQHRVVWVRSIGHPVMEGNKCIRLFGVIQDISQQKGTEEALRLAREDAEQSALRLQLANDSVGIGVWEWDLVRDEIYWDKWMYALYGQNPMQCKVNHALWEQSLHPEDRQETITQLHEARLNKQIFDAEFRIVPPNQSVKWIKASGIFKTDEQGNLNSAIGVNYDITDKMTALRALDVEKQRAETATRAKGEFLANMSHEIRTPMNAILGGLQLLQNVPLDPHHETILNNATFSARSLLVIINDILDYSKIEANKLTLESAPFLMHEVLRSVEYDLSVLVSQKGIDFQITYKNGFVDGWLGDMVRVKQILLNLASNAVKFTHAGSVKIIVGGKNFNGKHAIHITITDTGIGMTDETRQRIFERFNQADTSTTRKFGGTGLGMAITLNLVQMMQGDIRIASTLGRGTKVVVVLPLVQTKAEDSVLSQRERSTVAPLLRDKKILIAEDNSINQVIIQSMLAPTHAKLITVENGKQAVHAVQQEAFDLVLMDIHMPEMDGVEAQQKIAETHSHLPIVALTANVLPEDVNFYLAQGFIAHIGKPVDVGALYGVLENLISTSEAKLC